MYCCYDVDLKSSTIIDATTMFKTGSQANRLPVYAPNTLGHKHRLVNTNILALEHSIIAQIQE